MNIRAHPVFFAGVSGPQAVHSYQCPATRLGRTVAGPCDCGGEAAQAYLDRFWAEHSLWVEEWAKQEAALAFKRGVTET